MSDSPELLKPSEVTDRELQNDLSNLKAENEKLQADYAALLESSTHVTNKLRQEVQEVRSQLATEKTKGKEMWEELSDTEQTLEKVRAEKSDLQKTCDELRSELVDREKELAVALAALTENQKPEKKSAPGVELPDAATILSQLRTRRKKSKTDLGDVETLLAILEPDTD